MADIASRKLVVPELPSTSLPAESAELYAECCSTDPVAQAAAYEKLWRYLYRVALQLVRDQPEAEELAQDCAQIALVRVYERLAECREPAAFQTWARRIVSHVAIDELRARKQLVSLDDTAEGDTPASVDARRQLSTEEEVLEEVGLAELRQILGRAPISDRSRRVVVGRYLDDVPDEQLAQVESKLTGQRVLPSHVQVTRSKDVVRLRTYGPLRAFLERGE